MDKTILHNEYYVRRYKQAIVLAQTALAAVEECKHYKNIDAKFANKFTAKVESMLSQHVGARFEKNYDGKTLNFIVHGSIEREDKRCSEYTEVFRLYSISSWDSLKKQLEETNDSYVRHLKTIEKQILALDDDRAKMSAAVEEQKK